MKFFFDWEFFNSNPYKTDEQIRVSEIIKEFENSSFEEAEVILTLGGDGTFLKTVKNHFSTEKLYVGIGAGTENFLLNKFSDVELRQFLQGNLDLETVNLRTISTEIKSEEGIRQEIAINEVTIEEALTGWTTFDCEDYEGVLGCFKGDKLIVSTPTGSTGLNYNAKGVVLPLGSKDWSIVGVAVAGRDIRYVVKAQEIKIKVSSRYDVYAVIDGKGNTVIPKVSEITLNPGSKIKIGFKNILDYQRKRRSI